MINLDEISWLQLAAISVIGLCIGSFLNVVITRYPRLLMQRWRQEANAYLERDMPASEVFNLAVPRSHCPHCHYKLQWFDLIPVVSFIWLKARCRSCQHALSWQYPVVEILNAVLLLFISLNFGINFAAFKVTLITEVLLVLAFIDLNTQLLPDDLTLGLLWFGLICSTLPSSLITASSAILAAAIAYSAPWLINFIYRLIRKQEGMGYGDFKCFAALGACLGMENLGPLFLLAISFGLIASLVALAFKRMEFQQQFPFGPAILLAGWLLLIWPQPIQQWVYEVLIKI